MLRTPSDRLTTFGTSVGLISIIAAILLPLTLPLAGIVIFLGTAVAAAVLFVRQNAQRNEELLSTEGSGVVPQTRRPAELLQMLESESDRIKKELLAQFNRLIEEYRATEMAKGTVGVYETLYELDYDAFVAIAQQKRCSLAVAAAAVMTFVDQYPQSGILFHPRNRATQS